MFPLLQSLFYLTPNPNAGALNLSAGEKAVYMVTPPRLARLTSLAQSSLLFLKEGSENRIPTAGCLQLLLQLGTSHL